MNRIKTVIVCVTYNSYRELGKYLDSVLRSFRAVPDSGLELDVVVADGSTEPEDFELSTQESNVHLYRVKNAGYFGNAAQAMQLYGIDRLRDADFVAISNVDIEMSDNFFSKLNDAGFPENTGWIAPRIFTLAENRDKNPKIISRPSKRKIEVLKSMYRFPILHMLYEKTLYKRKKIRPQYGEMPIYAGHGSFILLTREFFKRIEGIDYPIFLFGEEQYLAEEMRKVGLSAYYYPELEIKDFEHVSTGVLRKKNYYKYNHQALSYILDKYYE